MDSSTRYPLQLMDVRLSEAHLTRPESREETETENDGLPLKVEVASTRLPPDHVSVLLTLTVSGDEDPFDITLVLEGLFQSDGDLDDLDDDFWNEFHAVSAQTLIWPYARECLSTIAWRMRLDLPMLPTLNRLAMISAQEDDNASEATGPAVEGTG